MNIPILMYHKILPKNDNTDLTITTERFKEQMFFLKKSGYNSILLSELINSLSFNTKLPDKCVIITFDDAFSCIIEYAKPILDEIDFKAVVFVVVNAIGKNNYWDMNKNIPEAKCMDKGQLKYLLMNGWEIGSHGLTHSNLLNLTEKNLCKEIKSSKTKLENLLRCNINSFCYPFGFYNDNIMKLVKNSNYICACSVESNNFWVTENLFCLRRIFVKPKDSLFTFKRKISKLYLFYRGIRRR